MSSTDYLQLTICFRWSGCEPRPCQISGNFIVAWTTPDISRTSSRKTSTNWTSLTV